ncbi:MAG: S8 family serine peptidase, partial [Candidatus Delongbacteria bacterium]|nr:S8 family serine peptidase [Candidatus Delongbacteria bacterium]
MRRFLVVALMLIFSLTGLISQETKIVNGYKVARGERPVIDLSKVPVDAYEPGKLSIKIKPNIEEKLDKRYIRAATKGYVETGMASFDAINKSIGAVLYDRRFNSLLEIPGQHSVAKYEDRHRAWGFHLIYEVTFNKGQDVIAAVRQYAALEDVEYAEPVYKKKLVAPEKNGMPININGTSEKGDTGSKWTPNDPDLAPEQWHYVNTGQTINGRVGVAGVDCKAIDAWDIETGNPDFIVAIVDQGIQYDHPDIAANMWSGLGWDFGANDSSIEPDYHGTHVGGTVAAVTNNGIGVAGLAGGDGGAGTGAKLMSCQVFGPVTGGFDLAMIWAADQGASISQNSWVYTTAGTYEQSVLDAIDYFNANGGGLGLQGGITIFASGNGNELDTEIYPGYYSGAMAVAGHDNQGKRYYNSNTGDYVEICAPAVDVHSTWINSGYDAITGTSMACPHVSGAAAMIVSNTEGVLTAPELRFILSESVWDIYQYETDPTYAGKLGPGALDASAALTLAQTYLGGVPTANNLVSNGISTTEIDLTWELNEFNDEVLVAWVLDGQAIGDPVDQTVYSVGNTLLGGGEVIYYNNSTSYTHSGLTAETGYDYKIWSRAAAERQDNQGEWYQVGTYSDGRTAGGETLMAPIDPSASSMGFENSGFIPNGWTQDGSWTFIGSTTYPASPTEGSYFAYFSTLNSTKKIITPRLDLTNHTSVTVDFDYCVTSKKSGPTTYYDNLKVYYKTSLAGSWVQLGSEYSGSMTSWANGSLSINDADRSDDFYVAFEAIVGTRLGYGVSVDNIVI